uniref:Uncharacterized protein n=1 Tax=Myoviridae sp. ctP6q2 TaxID=2825096 RepID=A0A8S5UUW6_9CAUD|nr:MAG TPA: hypothetical protein [Myoviridae sp. ctP6q2]
MLQASLSLFKTYHFYLPFSFQNQWLVFWEISHATSPVSYADFPLYCQISISHTPSTTVFLQTPLCLHHTLWEIFYVQQANNPMWLYSQHNHICYK